MSKNPRHVFVMSQGKQADHAAIPEAHLLTLRIPGYITGKNLSIQIQISRDSKRQQYKLDGSEITMFINNFRLI